LKKKSRDEAKEEGKMEREEAKKRCIYKKGKKTNEDWKFHGILSVAIQTGNLKALIVNIHYNSFTLATLQVLTGHTCKATKTITNFITIIQH
jgi:hypothetical protein